MRKEARDQRPEASSSARGSNGSESRGPALVPSKKFRDRWIQVMLCRHCEEPLAIIHSRPLEESHRKAGLTAFDVLEGDYEPPCPNCGLLVAMVRDEDGGALAVGTYGPRARKFETRFRWTDPRTWGWWRAIGIWVAPEVSVEESSLKISSKAKGEPRPAPETASGQAVEKKEIPAPAPQESAARALEGGAT